MRRLIGSAIEPMHLSLSGLTTLARFWAGWRGRHASAAPGVPIILYEFEGCPFCRVAREAVSALQLSADIRPCPKGGKRFRPELMGIGGKAQFPYMIDPNTGAQMYESADISRYLYTAYGKRPPPLQTWPAMSAIDALFSSLAGLPRMSAGKISHGRTREVAEPLQFWGFEADPRARLIRELLCTMEIPYRLHTHAPEDGASPLLIDPNSGARLTTSSAARHYLLETYGH